MTFQDLIFAIFLTVEILMWAEIIKMEVSFHRRRRAL